MIPPLTPNEETAVLAGVIYVLTLVLLCALLERVPPETPLAVSAKAAIETPLSTGRPPI